MYKIPSSADTLSPQLRRSALFCENQDSKRGLESGTGLGFWVGVGVNRRFWSSGRVCRIMVILNVPNGVSLNAYNDSLMYNLLSYDNNNYLTPILKDLGVDSIYFDNNSFGTFFNSITQDKELTIFSIKSLFI